MELYWKIYTTFPDQQTQFIILNVEIISIPFRFASQGFSREELGVHNTQKEIKWHDGLIFSLKLKTVNAGVMSIIMICNFKQGNKLIVIVIAIISY